MKANNTVLESLAMRASRRLVAPLLLAVACGGSSAPNLDSPGTTIVCFGDSITSGVGSGAAPSYPEILAETLGARVVNAGVAGDTTATALARIESVLEENPWLVIVMLGGNDILRRVPIENTEANLRVIVERLLEKRVALLVVEIHVPLAGPYDELFERLGEDYGVPVLEGVLAEILLDPKLKSDTVHPNAVGYRKLAEGVAERVMPLIEARQRMTEAGASAQ